MAEGAGWTVRRPGVKAAHPVALWYQATASSSSCRDPQRRTRGDCQPIGRGSHWLCCLPPAGPWPSGSRERGTHLHFPPKQGWRCSGAAPSLPHSMASVVLLASPTALASDCPAGGTAPSRPVTFTSLLSGPAERLLHACMLVSHSPVAVPGPSPLASPRTCSPSRRTCPAGVKQNSPLHRSALCASLHPASCLDDPAEGTQRDGELRPHAGTVHSELRLESLREGAHRLSSEPEGAQRHKLSAPTWRSARSTQVRPVSRARMRRGK